MPKPQTLSALLTMYLMKNRRICEATQAHTRQAFRHLIDAVGDCELDCLCYADAEDFQGYLLGILGSRHSTVSFLKTVGPVLSWACRRGYVAENPLTALPKVRAPEPEIRAFTDAEVHAILGSANTNLWRARIIAALSAGLRRGEVLNLTWYDVDFERQIIAVQPKKDNVAKGVWEWIPKDYERREVPLTAELTHCLLLLQTELPVSQPYPMLPKSTYFLRKKGIGCLPERIRKKPDENWRAWTKIMNRAGIEGTFHDLRRTCITNWASQLPIHEVMELAGHSSIETTQRHYLALGPSYMERARCVSSIGATGLEPATS